ncbi:hypothetical protein PG993_006134 [Apiospora rasikravindrae]|uniref:Nephrocystin 3-like N-terminal domain-containing protein n=1 Tax=Apiospora rasikravindrae TaxID=990691 RepID=A0ABR1TAR9_9PEZI
MWLRPHRVFRAAVQETKKSSFQPEPIPFVTERVLSTKKEAPPVTASIFYRYEDRASDGNETDNQPTHDVAKILMSIFEQLIDQIDGGLRIAEDLRQRMLGNRPSPTDVSEAIITMLHKAPRACIFLDAVDECTPTHLVGMIGVLQHIQKETQIGIVMSDRVGSSDWTSNRASKGSLALPNQDIIQLQAWEANIKEFLKRVSMSALKWTAISTLGC